jgi:hypothetical protein
MLLLVLTIAIAILPPKIFNSQKAYNKSAKNSTIMLEILTSNCFFCRFSSWTSCSFVRCVKIVNGFSLYYLVNSCSFTAMPCSNMSRNEWRADHPNNVWTCSNRSKMITDIIKIVHYKALESAVNV